MRAFHSFLLLCLCAFELIQAQNECNVSPSGLISTRLGSNPNSLLQKQLKDLYCLEVLDKIIVTQWQKEIDGLSVNDLNFTVPINIPPFSSLYSNPESEWILDEGMALQKLDRCVRGIVGKVAAKMDEDEVQCLNTMYTEYLKEEKRIAKKVESFIAESSKEQLPFKTFYNYYEIVQHLFDNKNIAALDSEQTALHEDMVEFYIKTEEDKDMKIFIVEQECEWKNSRAIREIINEGARYEEFARQVRNNVKKYLAAEILRKWKPGIALPDYRYTLWTKARQTMERDIVAKVNELHSQRQDAQYLCQYAAEFANKYFIQQKEILFDKVDDKTVSSELKTLEKYNYIVELEKQLKSRNDNRLAAVQRMVQEITNGHFCLTNFVRMIENHQRYSLASTFADEKLPYGNTYCHIKEMAPGLVNPRYCKCQGTFCESFGLATLRAERYELRKTKDNTYKIVTKESYKVPPMDDLVGNANWRIFQEKFNTYWYRHQKNNTKA